VTDPSWLALIAAVPDGQLVTRYHVVVPDSLWTACGIELRSRVADVADGRLTADPPMVARCPRCMVLEVQRRSYAAGVRVG
jgi:hypothetical protein